jgi:hypothetical protein
MSGSVYDRALPPAFPHCLLIERFYVPRIVELLTSGDHVYRNGSSFAVTADAPNDLVKLWLSDCSAERLYENDVLDRLPSTAWRQAT